MTPLARIFAALGTQPPAPPLTDAAEIKRRYGYWRVRVMYAMVVGYALFYFLRNNLPMAAKAICDEFHFSNKQWGLVLSTATIVYAFSKFLSGIVGDRANPRFLLALGLLCSAVVSLFFGLGHGLVFFIGAWALNNLFQGAGVPPCIRLLTYWYSPGEIGRAWGVWNASHQIGGAIIALWAGWLVAHHGWRAAFWAPALVGLVGGAWLLNRLTDSPEAMGLPPGEVFKGEAPPEDKPRMPFRDIFRTHILTNKWVWIVSVANFFVYVVRIGILSWTPKYLVEAKGFTLQESSYSLSGFEVAGIFGAYASGWLSDRIFRGHRAPVSVGFMALLVGFLLALFLVPNHGVKMMTFVFSALGFLVYGPQMLVAVAAADFATKEAASSAVGLTGLFGYIGASVCGVTTGALVDALGWNAAIWFYVGAAVVGCALLATTWGQISPLVKLAQPNSSTNPTPNASGKTL